MKNIIARERAEERGVAVVCGTPQPMAKEVRTKRVLLISGGEDMHVTRPVTTRSGKSTGSPQSFSTPEVSSSSLNPNATPFYPPEDEESKEEAPENESFARDEGDDGDLNTECVIDLGEVVSSSG